MWSRRLLVAILLTICTAGWPSTDAQRLVDDIRAQGVRVAYAGDYDPSGLAIAAFMATRFGAEVLMSDEDYLAAARGEAEWDGPASETPWCPALQEAIRQAREVRYQEDSALRKRLVAQARPLTPDADLTRSPRLGKFSGGGRA